jgi:hypothetical protein
MQVPLMQAMRPTEVAVEDDQAATVLQLPAQPVTTVESNAILRYVQS